MPSPISRIRKESLWQYLRWRPGLIFFRKIYLVSEHSLASLRSSPIRAYCPRRALYAASKSAVNSFFNNLRTEVSKFKINVMVALIGTSALQTAKMSADCAQKILESVESCDEKYQAGVIISFSCWVSALFLCTFFTFLVPFFPFDFCSLSRLHLTQWEALLGTNPQFPPNPNQSEKPEVTRQSRQVRNQSKRAEMAGQSR